MTCRLAVLVSGSGTNLQAILDATTQQQLDAEVVAVFANKKKAFGLTRAEQAGVPTVYFPLKPYLDAGRSRLEFDADLAEQVSTFTPDLIVLAGWMLVLSPAFLDHFPNRVINLHPALPDTFPGTEAIRRAFEAYQQGEIDHSGCMVHYAVPEVDAGPVISQEIVPIHPTDTLASFETRLHAAEHRIIVEAIRRACKAVC